MYIKFTLDNFHLQTQLFTLEFSWLLKSDFQCLFYVYLKYWVRYARKIIISNWHYILQSSLDYRNKYRKGVFASSFTHSIMYKIIYAHYHYIYYTITLWFPCLDGLIRTRENVPCEQSPLVFLLGTARRSERDSAELVYKFIWACAKVAKQLPISQKKI
jgi:hypothetical protein